MGDQVVARAAKEPFGFVVDVGETPLRIKREEGVGDALERRRHARGEGEDLRRGVLALGDVLDHALRADDGPRHIAHGLADRSHADPPEVGRDDLELEVVRRGVAGAGVHGFLDRRP
jgi:hypothetical protein